MELLDVRVESGLKELIKKLGEEKELSQSEIARALMKIGIAVEREGGIKISGPFGVSRPLLGPFFGGKDDRLGVRIEENLIETLKNVIDTKLRSAARRAMRNGSLIVWPEEVKIEGIFGIIRPFSQAEVPELRDEEARELLKKLTG